MPMVQGVLLATMELLATLIPAALCAQPYTLGPDSQLVFPDLRKFETWEGAGHFLMTASIVLWRTSWQGCDRSRGRTAVTLGIWKLQRSEGAASGAWKRCTTKWKA